MAQRTGLAARGYAALALQALVCACGDPALRTAPEVRVRVDRVVIDENHAPVVVLEE